MGIKRTYYCCLCKKEFYKKEDAIINPERAIDKLHGIHWQGNYFDLTGRESERHICIDCLKSASKVYKQIKEN